MLFKDLGLSLPSPLHLPRSSFPYVKSAFSSVSLIFPPTVGYCGLWLVPLSLPSQFSSQSGLLLVCGLTLLSLFIVDVFRKIIV